MYQDKLASLKRQLQQLQEGNFWVVFFAAYSGQQERVVLLV